MTASRSSHAGNGYLASFAVAMLLPLVLMVALSQHLGAVRGDLTRLGRLAERDFAPSRASAEDALQLHRADPAQARVVVLGDSFSRWNLWQSPWMDLRGQRDVISFTWDDIGGPGCLAAWAQGLRGRYPGLHHLVVQTVERSWGHRLMTLDAPCAVAPAAVAPLATADERIQNLLPVVWWPPPDPHYAVVAWQATRKRFDHRTLRQQTVVWPLARPDLFTNRRSDRLLTLVDDDQKRDWSAERLQAPLQRVRRLQDDLQAGGVTMRMVVVPDKSSIYAPYLARPAEAVPAAVDAWGAMDAAGIRHVAIQARLRAALPATRDLYLPNDTHLGAAGYRLLADAVHADVGR
ncbi:alginate O-acetyltransferase AlgX-related protein [Ideonella sp. A 288]|uniref:alginate O-acetyltransferase AlgX-related protein n=1 Tax=Ideonella sp. A 288 TaxID=1962181 RepID=UPI000B4B2092|nr:hypothetical protein [Ideonella sp. A 288]